MDDEKRQSDQPATEPERRLTTPGPALQTAPLLPRWLSLSLYSFFILWTLFACIWLGYAMVIQHRILGAIEVIGGPWEGAIPPMDSPAVEGYIGVFEKKPRDGLLYIVQQLRQDQIGDERMARAIALRKVTGWGMVSSRRVLLDELLENMNQEGELESGYELPPEQMRTLEDLLQERRSHQSDSYEENKITEVLQWIADGCPTAAKGPERRRISSLRSNYAKKTFFGKEKIVLTAVMEQWRQSDDPLRISAAEKFALMVNNLHAELTPQEIELCTERADHWETLYLEGQRRLALAAYKMVGIVAREGISVDHPHLWDLVRLMDLSDEQARSYIARSVLTLKQRKYIFINLSTFAQRSAINPVMAVETSRLSKAEHEDELKAELLTLRLASIQALRQIGLEYCHTAFEIKGVPAEEQERFFKARVVGALQNVQKDRSTEITSSATEALSQLREVGPQYFE